MIKFLFLSCALLFSISSSFASEFFAYIDNFRNVKLSFVQKNPDGTTAGGLILFASPKKFRIQYSFPYQAALIFNAGLITYHDYDLEETSNKILSKSGETYKLSEKFYSLLKEKSNKEDSNMIFFDTVENNSIKIIFNLRPVYLKSLHVKSVDNDFTDVEFFDVHYGQKFSKKLFTEF